jgi:hypothetical protein
MKAYPAILLVPLGEGKVILIAGSGFLGLVSRETESNGNALMRADKKIDDIVRPLVLAGLLVLLSFNKSTGPRIFLVSTK